MAVKTLLSYLLIIYLSLTLSLITIFIQIVEIHRHVNHKMLFRNVPSYKSCDHKEPSGDSRKLPGRLNSISGHSQPLDSESILKQQKHTIYQPA